MLKFKGVVCLSCGSNLQSSSFIIEINGDEISTEDIRGLKSGEMKCQKCGEQHDYSIHNGKLNLSRRAVPRGYTGSTEETYYSTG